MKIHMEFNSLAELLNTSKTLAGGLTPAPVKEDKDLPVGAGSWKQAYETTLANLERAYERIREFNDLKKWNKVISAEIEKIESQKRNKEKADCEALKKDHINNLMLSARAHNCLVGAGIITITQLLDKSAYDLMALPNFGKLSLKDVRDTLKANKLSLKGE